MNAEECLAFLKSRRSIRAFGDRAIPRATLTSLLEAAVSAPSNTNRQPWKFAVVTDPKLKAAIVGAVRERSEKIQHAVEKSHHAADFANYGDFFHEPLETAAAIIVPHYRAYPDLIADLIASGGGDPRDYTTPAAMQAELCSTCAACMALLLQAHATGLGACWMAGPMVARDVIRKLLGITEPYRMLGAIALGYPADAPASKPTRKPLDRVVAWFEDSDQS
jgi:nitroreductase